MIAKEAEPPTFKKSHLIFYRLHPMSSKKDEEIPLNISVVKGLIPKAC
jgi:hypothetical protein